MKGRQRDLDNYRNGSGIEGDYPIFPDPGGIFPIGANDHPDTIVYLTKGDPDDWRIAVIAEYGPVMEFDLSLTAFLARLFKGDKSTLPWKQGWFKKKKVTFKPSAPSTKSPQDAERLNLYQLYVRNGNKADFWATYPMDGSGVVYHVRKIRGKTEGPLKGSPPNYDEPLVVADAFMLETGESAGKADLRFSAAFLGHQLVPPPPWAASAKKKK